MESCENCDFMERLNQLRSTPPDEMLYGKTKLTSHKKYHLNNVDKAFTVFRLYDMFKYNIIKLVSAGIFKYKWVHPDELLTATKGKIWDWSNDEEKEKTKNSIYNTGLHFPIFTLDKGIPHNQIDPLSYEDYKDKYNSYNGNHRIDAIQELYAEGRWNKKVLIIIIPEYCEKCCNGFRYTPINYCGKYIPDIVYRHTLKEPIQLFHLKYLEDEMKMYNLPTTFNDIMYGVDVVNVIDYQAAFRILQEFQNALEVPFEVEFTSKIFLGFTEEEFWLKTVRGDECVFTAAGDMCNIMPLERKCDKYICCMHCLKDGCTQHCKYTSPNPKPYNDTESEY